MKLTESVLRKMIAEMVEEAQLGGDTKLADIKEILQQSREEEREAIKSIRASLEEKYTNLLKGKTFTGSMADNDAQDGVVENALITVERVFFDVETKKVAIEVSYKGERGNKIVSVMRLVRM